MTRSVENLMMMTTCIYSIPVHDELQLVKMISLRAFQST